MRSSGLPGVPLVSKIFRPIPLRPTALTNARTADFNSFSFVELASNASDAPCWAAKSSRLWSTSIAMTAAPKRRGDLHAKSAYASHADEYGNVVGSQPGAAYRLKGRSDGVGDHGQEIECDPARQIFGNEHKALAPERERESRSRRHRRCRA